MIRNLVLALGAAALLAGCATGPTVDGAGVYRISANDTDQIRFRMLDAVNALRAGAGAPPLQMNGALNAAAQSHARDMSRQGRAWPFGGDGASPYVRVARNGYRGRLVAEVYSQSFETELATLAAWVDSGVWGEALLDPEATDFGLGWQQDPTGLIWWAVTLGDASPDPVTG